MVNCRKEDDIMKKALGYFLILVLIIMPIVGNVSVFASSNKEYRIEQHMIKKFEKSRGKLTVKVEGSFYNQSWEKTNEKKISYKISKNCKWLKVNFDNLVSGQGSKYIKSSYGEIKKEIRVQREQYLNLLDGYEYDSPVGMSIVVKNDKIIKVIVLM